MNERQDERTVIEVGPQLKLTLHQSEIFGPRYQLYIAVDKTQVIRLDIEHARKLNEALTSLLAKVES
jgi:hypothetical protein